MCKSIPRRMMTTIVWTCFALIFAAFVQGYELPRVEVTPRAPKAVRIGESHEIMCRVGQPLKVCRFETPSHQSFVLVPGPPSEDGLDYFGDGLETGQCGLRIQKVKEADNGTFKCALTTTQNRAEVSGTSDLIVARPPQLPVLSLSPGSIGRTTYRAGEKLEISCSAPGGRPAANVSLFLDNEPIKEFGVSTFDSGAGDRASSQNISYALKLSDNGKWIRCVVDHIALDSPKDTKRQLDVHYQPQGPSIIKSSGYVIGRPGTINVTVEANPMPRFVWEVNGEKINEGTPDSSGRLQPSTAIPLGDGKWRAELKIETVQKSDMEKEYLLEARNDQGATKYQIKLYTTAEPEGVDIDAGYIVGIVVGVLVLILLISLIIFARATGRWCFAGGSSTRNIGESSDTESAGRYSRTEVDSSSRRPRRPRIVFSQLFRRNKDKVSGADTDTMRTVVTVDDEKMPELTEETQKTNTGSEGGLVYAELDLTQREQAVAPRRVSEDKTEYAEILYTKPEGEETNVTPDKK